MTKHRVLLLNYEYPPLGGGGSNATKYLLRELAKRDDVDVDVVTSSATGQFEQEKIGENVTIYKLAIKKKEIHYWTQKEVLDYSLKCRSYVKEMLKTKQYDICHAFFGIPCGAIAMLFDKKMPYIVSIRGSDVPGFNKRFSAMYIALKPLIKVVWNKAGAIVANSHNLASLAHKTDSKVHIDIITNGVDTEEFKPKDRTLSDHLRILCVSRLIQRKGIRFLIDAFKTLKDDGVKVTLTIAGEGNQEAELREITKAHGLEDSINFLGYVEHDELPKLYNQHDVFVLPSLNEGMSNSLLEALAQGLAIITTDTGGIKEIINDDEDVILIPVEDAQAIVDSIRKVTDSSVLHHMQTASRHIAEKMSWQKVADQYIKIYAKVRRGAE